MQTWTPQTTGYDEERRGFQLNDPHRPDQIFAITSAADIQHAVRQARQRNVGLAVRAAGHGHTNPLTGGVLVTTGRYAGVAVDPVRRTATVQAGATWQQVVDATVPHGLAPLSGSFPHLGAVPYTLGGGIGLMARKYGYAADHVRRISLVTPDGRLRSVGPGDDLFWAARGAGGNFGVVAELELDLFPVTTVYGGSLSYDLATSPEILTSWRDWTATVPDDVTSAVTVLVLPDLPQVPAVLRGRHVAQVHLSILAAPQAAEELIAPLRAVGEPLLDTVAETPYQESGRIFAEPDQPHAYRSRNVLLSTLDPTALTATVKLAGPDAGTMCVVGIRHLGGALSQPPAVPNALSRRDAQYGLTVLSPGDGGVSALHTALLEPWTEHVVGRLLNFSFGQLTPAEVGEAFTPADHARLLDLRAQYDPAGLLRPNHPL